MKIKKQRIWLLGLVTGLLLLGAVLFCATFERNALQAKPESSSQKNSTRGTARQLNFYLRVSGVPVEQTSVDGIKFQLEVKKADNTWEKVTGSDGKSSEFITRENGRIQLLEEQLQDLEKRYGSGPYRFYETETPSVDYWPAKGDVSNEFTIDTSPIWNKTVTMYNYYCGTFTMTATAKETGHPLADVKMVIQYQEGGSYKTIDKIAGVPSEFVTNAAGKLTLTSAQIIKIKENNPTVDRFYLAVVATPSGYRLPPSTDNQASYSIEYHLTVNPHRSKIEIYSDRLVRFQKNDQITRSPIPGVEFELQVASQKEENWQRVDEHIIAFPLITDQKGQIILSDSDFDSLSERYPDSRYRFKETKACEGYYPPNDQSVSDSFTISKYSEPSTEIFMENEPMSEQLKLQKVDTITKQRLKGATFIVQKQVRDDWVDDGLSLTTDDSGEITLKKEDLIRLGEGTFRFKETKAPAGYILPTDEGISDDFVVSTGGYVSTSDLSVSNIVSEEEKSKIYGEFHIHFQQYKSSFKEPLDKHSGKGYATQSDGERGWIRSNDTFQMRYEISPEVTDKHKSYEKVKMRVTAEVLDKKGYSDFADSQKLPLQNVTFEFETPGEKLKSEGIYDPEKKTVKAFQEFIYEKGQGSGSSLHIDAKVGSSFDGTELPLKYTLEILSAVDINTGKEIRFDEGEQAKLHTFDMPLTIPNNTLKVTSKLNMIPIVSGPSDFASTYPKVTKVAFNDLVDENVNSSAKVASVGYGWKPTALAGRSTNSKLGWAVPKGNNRFQITLEQGVMATLSNGVQIPVTLGKDSELPWIDIFSYGIPEKDFGNPVGQYKGKYLGYKQDILSKAYKNFRLSPDSLTLNYELKQDDKTGDFIAIVEPPFDDIGKNELSPTIYVYFDIGSYLVYPAQAASILARANSSVIQQDYTLGIKGASYQDNDGEVLEAANTTKSGYETTWSETFDENKPTAPEDDRFLILEKLDKPDGFLLTGAKFELQYKDPVSGIWETVTLPGFTSFESDRNGQVVLNEQQLDQLFKEYSGGKTSISFRFKEVQAPEGYRDPDKYHNENEVLSQEFKLEETTVSRKRVNINNRPKNPVLNFEKQGKDDEGTTVSLEGAVFDLYFFKESKGVWERVDIEAVFALAPEAARKKFVSDKDGRVRLTAEDVKTLAASLDYGPGRYRFKEIIPPPGYILPEEEKRYTPSFHLTEDDTSWDDVDGIIMENQREPKWEHKQESKSYSSYGYEVQKDGKPMFAKVGSYKSVPTLDDLLKNAVFYSKEGNSIGSVLRGEEIVVGSSQVATCYSYASDNENYKENWQAKKAEMIQLWNPAEGELLEAGYDFFEDMDCIGETHTIRYGVKTDRIYTNEALNNATKASYKWYEKIEDVPVGQQISAVYGEVTNFKADYRNNHKQPMETRWNLYTRRVANGKVGNTDNGIGSYSGYQSEPYYETYTRSTITYENFSENPKEGEHEKVLEWSDSPYTPTRYTIPTGSSYDQLGLNPHHNTPSGDFAATLLIIPYYLPKIEKIAVDPVTKEPKESFSINELMEFRIKLSFGEPREGIKTLPFELGTFQDIVNYKKEKEDNFFYLQNSTSLNTQRLDNPEKYQIVDDRYLAWQIPESFYNETGNYEFNFQAFPRQVGKFTNRIEYLGNFYGPIYTTCDVQIDPTLDHSSISKNTSTPVIDKAGTSNDSAIEYTITLRNFRPDTSAKDVRVLDVLPTNGDGAGSKFLGGYSLENMTAKRIDGTDLNDVKYYYTTKELDEKLTKELNAENAFEKLGNDWKEFKDITSNGDDQNQVTAIYVTMPDLPAGLSYTLSLELLPYDNEVGDSYFNQGKYAYQITDGNEKPFVYNLQTEWIPTVVVNRTIAGNVWEDLDYTGVMADEEPRIPNVAVNLYRMSGEQLSKVAETTTDKDGQYHFDGVASGYFKVGFRLPEEFADFLVTKTNVSGNPLLTNKVSQILVTEDDYHLTQDDVQVPFVEYETDEQGKETLKPKSLIEIKGINMGILSPPKMKVKKSVFDQAGNNIADKSVKIGDLIRYQIDFTNEGSSMITDVHLNDVLPVGLELNDGKKVFLEENEQQLKEGEEFTYLSVLDEFGDPVRPEQYELDVTLGNVGPGKKLSIYFDVKVTESAEGKLTNVATATATLPPGAKEPDPAEVTNCDTPAPNLIKSSDWDSVSSEPDPVLPQPGVVGKDVITYMLEVSNAAGASTWRNVMLTDILNEEIDNVADYYLEYVPDSTKLGDSKLNDADVWSKDDEGRDQLNVNLGVFEGSESGERKTVTFQAKLLKQPPLNDSAKTPIRNYAKVTGKGLDCQNKENDFWDDDTNILDISKQSVRLHVRQLVIENKAKELVIPSKGYVNLIPTKNSDGTDPLNASTMMQNIRSIDLNKSGYAMSESFTHFRVPLLTGQQAITLDLVVPEYYEYMGAVVTDDIESGSPSEEKHKNVPADKPKPFVVPLKANDEKWITLFIKPKYAIDETSPRPYSWDYATNKFGTLSFEEQEKNKKSIAE